MEGRRFAVKELLRGMREFEEAGREGSLGCDGEHARPAVKVGSGGGLPEPGRVCARAGLGQLSEEGRAFPSPSPADACAWGCVGRVADFPCAAERADERGIDCQLGPVIEGQAVGQDLDLAGVTMWDGQVHAGERNIGCDSGSGFAADACQHPLQRDGTTTKHPRGGARCAVVPYNGSSLPPQRHVAGPQGRG